MTVNELNVAVLAGAAVLLVAIVAVRLSVGTGMPSLLIYLGLGVLIGEAGLGLEFDDYQLTAVLGYAALALILAEGGLSTRWESVRPAVPAALVLATAGTTVSIVVTGVAAHYLLGFDWTTAMLLAAVLSSTDAAAVFSVLRRVPLPRRLTSVLEAESGFNDAPVVIAVVALTQAFGGQSTAPWWLLVLQAVAQLVVGAVIGLAVAALGASWLRAIALPSSGLYPIAVLSLCALAYGAAATLGTSGFIAVYVAGLVLGNVRLPHRSAVRGFAEGTGWIGQIGLFVLLGLVVRPSEVPDVVVPALGVGLALLLVGRPASVVLSLLPFRMPWREQAFLSWAGLRGAVPIVLATIPANARTPGTENLLELVFVLVVVFTVVQAPVLPAAARLLRLHGDETRGVEVEASPLGAIGAELLQVSVPRGSRMGGVAVFELRLPAGANVALVVRDGQAQVPTPQTVMRAGDELLVVTTAQARDAAEDRLRLVGLHGRLAQWRASQDGDPGRSPRGGGLARTARLLGRVPGARRLGLAPPGTGDGSQRGGRSGPAV
ncbi:potassium/proton antiporter [Thalassiella azotivora]